MGPVVLTFGPMLVGRVMDRVLTPALTPAEQARPGTSSWRAAEGRGHLAIILEQQQFARIGGTC